MKVALAAAAAAALILAAPAPAYLIGERKDNTLQATIAYQRLNLSHAQYVCRHGTGKPRAWSCGAIGWISRELRESLAKLAPPAPAVSYGKWACIHSHEGAWNSNTGNGYYGGLQMDWPFMRHYGGEFLARWGTADHWPVWAQITAAERAYRSRGYAPWPNTARTCGLL